MTIQNFPRTLLQLPEFFAHLCHNARSWAKIMYFLYGRRETEIEACQDREFLKKPVTLIVACSH